MKKFFLIIASMIAGIAIGISGTLIFNARQPEKPSNFTVRTINSVTKT